MINIPIIFENEDYLIINKPNGVVVNRAESVKEATLQDWMEERYVKKFDRSLILASYQVKDDTILTEFLNRSGVVHRLDKDTSGVMVLAKTVAAFVWLKAQFKDRKTKKTYAALVHGKLEPAQGTIHLPLKRNPLNRRRFTVHVDGKMARTRYEVADYFHHKQSKINFNETFTLLNLAPVTGRTHQLRVHLSHLGYPIVADPIYLGKRLKDDTIWCPRLFLHAKRLSFFSPNASHRVEYEAPLASDLEASLARLEVKSYV